MKNYLIYLSIIKKGVDEISIDPVIYVLFFFFLKDTIENLPPPPRPPRPSDAPPITSPPRIPPRIPERSV